MMNLNSTLGFCFINIFIILLLIGIIFLILLKFFINNFYTLLLFFYLSDCLAFCSLKSFSNSQ
jgi:TM2 domain-containing membrane protein YozV